MGNKMSSISGKHEFVALHDDEVEWQEGESVNEL